MLESLRMGAATRILCSRTLPALQNKSDVELKIIATFDLK